MTTHSSILAWEIPWTGVPGRLQSVGAQDLATKPPRSHFLPVNRAENITDPTGVLRVQW